MEEELTAVEKALISKLKRIAEDKNDVLFIMLWAIKEKLQPDLLAYMDQNHVTDMDDVFNFMLENAETLDDEDEEDDTEAI